MDPVILSINGGSSSIKFSLFKKEDQLVALFSGHIQRIGVNGTVLFIKNLVQNKEQRMPVDAKNIQGAVAYITDWLDQHSNVSITAIGHRIVYGINHTRAALITDILLDELEKSSSIDPDHMPGELLLIKAFKEKYPKIPQIACFDTSFHTTMPQRAIRFALPRRYFDSGVRRYGFHGISYSYLMQKLGEEKKVNINGKIILAHLGNGASMVAVKNQQSMDTSMGFSPAGGFPMSTRSGDIDPGIVSFIMKDQSLTATQFNDTINHQSGLLGISETSPDMQDLLKTEKSDERAAEAVDIFCYQVKKWIGSFSAVLSGLDTLVFSGGIGENAPVIRNRICDGMQWLGIELDEVLNNKSEKIISTQKSKVTVYVIPTDEEFMMAKMVCGVLSIN
jgi:acetate kinase